MRTRTCRDQTKQCIGDSTQAKDCGLPDCIRQWQEWGEWSACTASCGQGLEVRARACNQATSEADDTCPGDATVTRICSSSECPGISTNINVPLFHVLGQRMILHLVAAE